MPLYVVYLYITIDAASEQEAEERVRRSLRRFVLPDGALDWTIEETVELEEVDQPASSD